ncbi:hypothetical protein BST22_00230 [Mycolicibacterium chubuense]|uniref:Uncharacterized protein n=1 Tax=Mycolicibacterium chubuense TaxID=1800 RepID=A0A0J6VQG0_MYCCU|nr:hypothetical protein [Mycolicibacterium chubuense]KMO72424.1 hypothetical protein MCHUDSM44219_04934 [Mycolicibacterium chubuense]ORA56412.1 hypothetical protein BST22_00230 [Mycolicibacterium chubuense]SPX99174.1 Uncharacterised protein [Mycolicibacterium chubuense]
MGIRTAARRLLSRRVSVYDIVELSLWLAIPYVGIGLTWAFFQTQQVARLEDVLTTRVPAGADILSYLLVAALWPLDLLMPAVCAA